jgi:transketolase
MALAARLQGATWRVVILCGDGELNEGQNWEAFMAIAKWRPSNLIAIVDRNRVQLDGLESAIMPLGDIAAKVASFGLHVESCNGHDCAALRATLERAAAHAPAVLIAETVKGKGVSFMEGQAAWHGKPVDDAVFDAAMAELNAGLEALGRI